MEPKWWGIILSGLFLSLAYLRHLTTRKRRTAASSGTRTQLLSGMGYAYAISDGQPVQVDLDLVDTNDLVNEIFNRFDVVVLVSLARHSDNRHNYKLYFKGEFPARMVLAQQAMTHMAQIEHGES